MIIDAIEPTTPGPSRHTCVQYEVQLDVHQFCHFRTILQEFVELNLALALEKSFNFSVLFSTFLHPHYTDVILNLYDAMQIDIILNLSIFFVDSFASRY